MVGHTSIEGECRDVEEWLEVLICRTKGVYKAQDAREVLDADGVPNEGVRYENSEGSTHLYPRYDAGDDDIGYIHDVLYECMIRKDAASEDVR